MNQSTKEGKWECMSEGKNARMSLNVGPKKQPTDQPKTGHP